MRCILTLLLLLFFAVAKSQTPFFKEITIGENDQLLPVAALAQGSNGYLYVATSAGMYSYNGRSFVLISGELGQQATSIACVAAKTYIGYKNGDVGVLFNNKMTKLIPGEQTENNSVNDIDVINDSTFLLSTDGNGIFYQINGAVAGRLTSQEGLADDYVYLTLPLKKESLYLACTDGGVTIFSIAGSKFSITNTITKKSGLPDNVVRAAYYNANTNLLITGSQQGGVACIELGKGNNDSVIFTTKEWKWGQVNDILGLTDSIYWVATESGNLIEVFYQNNSFHTRVIYTCNKQLRKLSLDKAGNVWCGTNADLISFSSTHVTNIVLSANYSLQKVTAVACTNNGLIYALGNTVYMLDSKNKPFPLLHTRDVVTSMYAAPSGRLWIGTLGQGVLCREANGQLWALSCISELKNSHILSITGVNDTLWLAGLNGVEEIKTNDKINSCTLIRHHTKKSGIGSDYVYQLYADSKKRIWMATDGAGICCYNRGKYEHYNNVAGKDVNVVYSITEDVLGHIWFATREGGLLRFDNSTWSNYNKESGLTDLNISTVAATKDGRIIIVHKKGIDECNVASKLFRHYNRRLGMDIDSTSAILNCYGRDSLGNVYIPYEHGFIRFNTVANLPTLRPDIHIKSINLFSAEINSDKTLFRYDENSFSFRFDGINFTNPDRLYYRYQLTGYNDEWVVTNDETAIYPQLPPGKYTFKVQAALSPNFAMPSEVHYNFTIASPYWQKPWFALLCILTVTVAIVGFFRNRERKLKALSSLEKERYEYEYEYLKSQVNPHFLFNSLNTLVNLIDEDSGLASDYTINLSDFYRSLLSYNNKDTILLNEEWNLLEKYIYIQKSRFGEALEIQLNVTPMLMTTAKIVPMALQLLVENAIKHNVVSVSYPLHISITAADGILTIKNNIQPKVKKEKGAGLGLENLRKRYLLIGNNKIHQYVEDNNFIVKLPLL